ncbi:MAG: ROK family protein [Bryobacterales bacterium]|nr:ROK family protein [Bryobacterales bacterium]
MAQEFLIGIDLGGTKIAAAAFDLDGRRLGRIARLPTMARMQMAVTLTNMKRVVKQAKIEAGVDGDPVAVGMGSSGPLDPANCVLHDVDSLPNLVGFKIGRFSEREFGAPLFLENDAACFALGEAIHGAGKGRDIVLGITLGTGFGCGITIRGRIFSGATNNAGEVAYCRVGESDFDHACSGPGVVRQYRAYRPSKVDRSVTAKEIGDRAEKGEPEAIRAWRSYGRLVGTAIATLCCVIDPSVVVLGGSVSRRLRLFEETLMQSARAMLPGTSRGAFGVVASELGDSAGLTGAAEHARQHL